MHSNVLAVVFALASALTIAWGTVVRHNIAGEATRDGSLKGSPLINAITRPLWWAGTGTALLGYAFQVVALSFGTLLVVQPVLVLSLMFTLPLSARSQGRHITRHETVWATVLTFAVATVIVLGRPLPGNPHPPLHRWLEAIAVGAVALGIVAFVAHKLDGPVRSLLLGLSTGCIFGYVAVLSKAFVDIAVHDGLLAVITSWETYALIGGAALGTIVQQYSFNAGELRHCLPAMTTAEPITAFALGYIVLGEQFQLNNVGEWLVMIIAVTCMVTATFRLTVRKGAVLVDKQL